MNRTAVISPAFPHAWVAWLDTMRARTRRPGRLSVPATYVQAIARRHTFWVDRPFGRRIDCEQGSVWLTIDGEQRDVILEAGQWFDCDRHTRLGIYALTDARVRVQ